MSYDYKHIYQTKCATDSFFRFNNLFVIDSFDSKNRSVQLYIVYYIHTAGLTLSRWNNLKGLENNPPYLYGGLCVNLVNTLFVGENTKLLLYSKDTDEAMYVLYRFLNIYCIIPLFISNISKETLEKHCSDIFAYIKRYNGEYIESSEQLNREGINKKEISNFIGFKNVIYFPVNLNIPNVGVLYTNTTIFGHKLSEKLYEYSYS